MTVSDFRRSASEFWREFRKVKSGVFGLIFLAITTGLYICGLVILDLIYGLLDPRIKVGGR